LCILFLGGGSENGGGGGQRGVRERDYAQEAVEYFSGKLLQYGAGTEVPIRSLLGHRSQASPEVRHISGQHISTFREFLMRHPDAFAVGEESVILREFEGMQTTPFQELPVEAGVDPAISAQLIDFLVSCLEGKGPMLVDQLFHSVCTRFSQVRTQILSLVQSNQAPNCRDPEKVCFLPAESLSFSRNLILKCL